MMAMQAGVKFHAAPGVSNGAGHAAIQPIRHIRDQRNAGVARCSA